MKTKLLIPGAILLIVGVGVLSTCVEYSNTNNYTVTITDKQVKRKDEEDIYLIFTKLENGETRVFRNEDAFFKGKFNSSDMQAKLEIGHTYDIDTYGYRIPFMSMYENIYKAEEVESK